MKSLQNTKSLIAILAALLFSTAAAFAQVPDTPENLKGVYNPNSGEIILTWEMPGEPDNVDGFNIVWSDENSNEEYAFSIAISDIETFTQRDRTYYSYNMPIRIDENNNIYMFLIRAFNSDGESDFSVVFVLRINNPNQTQIRFTSTPVENAYRDALYTYDVDAVYYNYRDSLNNADIRYEIEEGPAEMGIDEETGVINWVPTEGGYYRVVVRAYLADDENVIAFHHFGINVSNCTQPIKLTLTINYENGDPVNSGTAMLMFTDRYGLLVEEIIDGQAEFEVEEGSYYLYYQGRGNYFPGVSYVEWYEDASTMEEATLIEVACDDEVQINMTVDNEPEYEMYLVSGRVTLTDGTPVGQAMVEFITSSDNPNGNRRQEFSAVTDQDGYYELELPDLFEYMAVCYGPFSSWRAIQYYNLQDNPANADIIELSGDRDDIDFVFEVPEDPNNRPGAIRGVVNNEDGNPIENVFVVAFQVDRNLNPGENFEGRAAMVDRNGYFSIGGLEVGTYILFAFPSAIDYAPGFYKEGQAAVWLWEEATRIRVAGRDTTDFFEIILPAIEDRPGICRLRGKIGSKVLGVLGGGGSIANSINGASIYLATEEGKTVKYGKSASDGSFELNNIKEDVYTLIIDKIGYEAYSKTVELKPEAQMEDLDVALTPGTSGVKDMPNDFEASVFPNPVSGDMTILFPSETETVAISLSDYSGAEYYKTNYQAAADGASFIYNVRDLPGGLYFVKITNGRKVSILPVIIVH